jgi:ABC-type spermidine/putrescine transport system permease subunit I
MNESSLWIGPLFVLYTVLLLYALAEWIRRPRARWLNRWVWLGIIVVFSISGPLAYLLLGRERG